MGIQKILRVCLLLSGFVLGALLLFVRRKGGLSIQPRSKVVQSILYTVDGHVPRTGITQSSTPNTTTQQLGLHFHDLENITISADMSPGEAEDNFYRFVTRKHVDCDLSLRFGNAKDGGWDMCVVPPYGARESCTVYSFGINNDWSFDDAISNYYNCSVRAFDPSMTAKDHRHSAKVWFYHTGIGGNNTVNSKGWKIRTLRTLLEELGNSQTYIDYLKIDIEYNEWDALEAMIREGALTYVKQLGFEIHTLEVRSRRTSVVEFQRYYRLLLAIENLGFRRWYWHYNHFGKYTSYRTGKSRTCCYELVYINSNFLTVQDPRPSIALGKTPTLYQEKIHKSLYIAYPGVRSKHTKRNKAPAVARQRLLTSLDSQTTACPKSLAITTDQQGSWKTCNSGNFALGRRPCLVYSFTYV